MNQEASVIRPLTASELEISAVQSEIEGKIGKKVQHKTAFLIAVVVCILEDNKQFGKVTVRQVYYQSIQGSRHAQAQGKNGGKEMEDLKSMVTAIMEVGPEAFKSLLSVSIRSIFYQSFPDKKKQEEHPSARGTEKNKTKGKKVIAVDFRRK